jgi:hypothetical protein
MPSMRLLPLSAALLLASSALLTGPALAQAPADAAPRITLSQAMADPDWIGPPVEQAWWSWDGQHVQYLLKREGASIRDTWQQGIADATGSRVDGAARAQLDAPAPMFDAQRTRMAFVRNGDVFVRDLRSGALTQVTRTEAAESLPQWSRDGNLVFRVGNEWYQWRAGSGVSQAAIVKAEKDPDAAPKADDLRERQLRLIRTLKDDRARNEAARAQDKAWRQADPSRAPAGVYLCCDVRIFFIWMAI